MLFQANVLGPVIDEEKEVGSPPRAIGGGLLVLYGDPEGVTLHVHASNADRAERRIRERLPGADIYIDELVETVPLRPTVGLVAARKLRETGRMDARHHLTPEAEDAEQERRYDIASADIVAPLATGEAIFVADSLETLAGIDEGEHTDTVELYRVAKVFRDLAEEAEA